MADAPTAAPAAPAPAAPAPAAPAPSTPSPSPSPANSSGGADKFGDLDARVASRPEKPAAPASDLTKGKGTAPAPEKLAAGAPAPANYDTIKDPKQLREQLKKVSTEHEASRSEIGKLQAKISEYERRGLDTTALSQQLATEQREKAELQSQIRMLKQEVDPAFKDKWDKPFDQKAAFAKRLVEGLPVTNEDGSERTATWNDFVGLFGMPANQAFKAAKQMFGDSSNMVIQQIIDLQGLDFNRKEALKEEKANWQKREQETVAQQAQHKEFIQKTWGEVNRDIASKHPDWYQETPGDDEGNALLKEGLALVDGKPSTVQEAIVRDAHVRLKAAAFPRLIHRMNKLQEKLDAAEAKIAEFQASKPGATQRPASGDKTGTQDHTGMTGLKDDLAAALRG